MLFLCGIVNMNAANDELGNVLSPTYTLPICYIHTEGNQPIDQKTTYIDATFYMIDSDGTPLNGSSQQPLSLGIRGRGNASWTHYDKKPYKLKFNKKQSLLGMPSNKHFALLNIPWGSFARYGNFFSFLLGKEIGLEWTPTMYPVEVVLNDDYIGLYYLSETVRIDETRLNISEQKEDNVDLETIDEGWLVEIDNYVDENQITLPADDPSYNSQNRFTVHTPEPMNEIHREWITQELIDITEAICDDNIYSRTWEQYIDVESLAKYFIVQEIVHNFDSFVGSGYFYKDKSSSKWCFGPIWDAGDNFEMHKHDWASWSTESSYSTRKRTWIKNIARHPAFWVHVREIWENFRPSERLQFYKDFFTEINHSIHEALYRDAMRWPEIYGDDFSDFVDIPWSYGLANNHIQWIDTTLENEYITHKISIIVEPDAGTVMLNGESYPEYFVFDGDEITLVVEPEFDFDVSSVKINGEDAMSRYAGGQITLTDIKDDVSIDIRFDKSMAIGNPLTDHNVYNVAGNCITVNSLIETYIYSVSGNLIWRGFNGNVCLQPGIYLVKNGARCSKIFVK